MWLERCLTCHEFTRSRIRIDNHETLMSNIESKFDAHEDLTSELDAHRGKVDTMTSRFLRDLLHEYCTLTQDHSSSTLLRNHTLNSATKFRPDASEAASELRNAATRLRHKKL